jgi:AcrR family transcriptional regulator
MAMTMTEKPRTLRSDAARNREGLLDVATRTYARSKTEPSMREIAREAGVGVGTLYRHFPTRETLVEAVYHDQVERLTHGAERLLAKHPPAVALRRWMDLFGEWLATKHGMIATLMAMVETGAMKHGQGRRVLLAALARILEAGRTAGDIRSDTSAEDISVSLIGIISVASAPAQKTQLKRLLDLLMDGLRPTVQAPGRRGHRRGAAP